MNEPRRLCEELPEGLARVLLESSQRDLAPVAVRRNVLRDVNAALLGAAGATVGSIGGAGTTAAVPSGLTTGGATASGMASSGASSGAGSGAAALAGGTSGAVGAAGGSTGLTAQGLLGKLALGVAQNTWLAQLGAAAAVKTGAAAVAIGATAYTGYAIVDSAAHRGQPPGAHDGPAPVTEPVPAADPVHGAGEPANRNQAQAMEPESAEPGTSQERLHTRESSGPSGPGSGRSPTSVQHSEPTSMRGGARQGFHKGKRSQLGRELAALSAVRTALNGGHAARALGLLDAYAAEFPSGSLTPEAQGLRARARKLIREKADH